MFDKISRYFKGKNPYLLASFALVLISLLIMAALVKLPSPVEETVTETLEVTSPESDEVYSTESTEEVPVIESEETADVETKTGEEEEGPGVLETEGAGAESAESFEETKTPDPVPVPEIPGESEENKEVKEETQVPTVPEPEEEEDPEPDEGKQPESEENVEEPPIAEPEVKTEETPQTPPQEPAHEHSWTFDSYYQKPTCSNGGLVNQICVHCGETQTTVGTPTGEHLYQVETPGDCCSAEVVICSECNHREVREKDPDNHIDEEDGFCYGCGQKTE